MKNTDKLNQDYSYRLVLIGLGLDKYFYDTFGLQSVVYF